MNNPEYTWDMTPESFERNFLPLMRLIQADEGREIRPAKLTPGERELLRAEYAKVWGDGKMIVHCVNDAAAIATLPGGEIVVVKKQRIETDFCFGESGYDYNEAQDMAQHARTSADYFKRKNMEHFTEWIQDITASMRDPHARKRLVIYTNGAYGGRACDCRLYNVDFMRLTDIIDACGGSCCVVELPGRELDVYGVPCRIATLEEHYLILRAWRAAALAHEKKVDAYLKRYGTSKVHAWTYWRDA